MEDVDNFVRVRECRTEKFGISLTPIAQQTHITDAPETTSADPSNAPAGGAGATAGAYDTAANRDLAIASINDLNTLAKELKADYNLAKTAINAILVRLENIGVVASA